ERAGAWFYQPNLGDGRLAPAQPVARIPALAGAAGRSRQLIDLDGDGALDFADLGPDGAGFYERTGDGDWAPLRAFAPWPRLRWDAGSVRLPALTGDGLAALLVTEDGGLVWHPSLGAGGFAAAVRVGAPADDERGPRVVFADGTQSIHLADLSGDG